MRDVVVICGATSTLRRRLYAKVRRTKRDECWRWVGAQVRKRADKRPAMQVGGRGSRVITVARILLAIRDRVLLSTRDGLEAGHTCGNYWCVNMRHLRWQTRTENEVMKSEHRRRAEQTRAENETMKLEHRRRAEFYEDVDQIVRAA